MNNYLLMSLKLFFSISSHITPFIAVRVAEKLFTTPFHSKRRDLEHEMLESAERFPIAMGKSRQLTGYRWGEKADPVVLLIHGS